MKQLKLINDPETKKPIGTGLEPAYWKMYVDGASRNNPGPSGAGIYVLKEGTVVYKGAFYLGLKTNNQAEYIALLIGLYYLQRKIEQGDMVMILSDSQLLVRQIQGSYKVKNSLLKPLHTVAQEWLKTMQYDIGHVMREENSEADELANAGVDKKIPVPQSFIDALASFHITV